jgi:hypothetical protein
MFTKEQGARSVRRTAGLAVAMAFAAGALITGATGAQAAPAQAAPVTALACTNVGNVAGTVTAFTLYDGNNWTGSCVTFWKYDNCTASTSTAEQMFNLAGWGWDNRANSVHTYHSCDVRLFDLRDCPHSGLHSTWVDESADLRLGTVNWQNKVGCVEIS